MSNKTLEAIASKVNPTTALGVGISVLISIILFDVSSLRMELVILLIVFVGLYSTLKWVPQIAEWIGEEIADHKYAKRSEHKEIP
jgi:hypothetical protein